MIQPASLLNLTLLHGCFSRLFNCTGGTKLRNASHIFRNFSWKSLTARWPKSFTINVWQGFECACSIHIGTRKFFIKYSRKHLQQSLMFQEDFIISVSLELSPQFFSELLWGDDILTLILNATNHSTKHKTSLFCNMTGKFINNNVKKVKDLQKIVHGFWNFQIISVLHTVDVIRIIFFVPFPGKRILTKWFDYHDRYYIVVQSCFAKSLERSCYRSF